MKNRALDDIPPLTSPPKPMHSVTEKKSLTDHEEFSGLLGGLDSVLNNIFLIAFMQYEKTLDDGAGLLCGRYSCMLELDAS